MNDAAGFLRVRHVHKQSKDVWEGTLADFCASSDIDQDEQVLIAEDLEREGKYSPVDGSWTLTAVPYDQSAAIEAAYLHLTKALARMGREAKDAYSPDYRERKDYLVRQVMDSAHEILDLAHDYKHALNLTNA
jgi:hypothetical protein